MSDSWRPHGLNPPGYLPNPGKKSSRGSSQPWGSNPGLPHCRQILYQLSHKGSVRIHLTEVGNPSLLQWIFLTQESNPGLLHCKWILYQLSHKNTGRKIQLITNIHNIWHISCYEIIEQPHFFLQTCWSPSMRLLGHVPSCPLFFPQSDVLKPHWHHNIYFING